MSDQDPPAKTGRRPKTTAQAKGRASGPRSSKAARISDVAALAGVSMMTVSRSINNPAQVTDSTREQVHKAIAELGYVPNAAARSLAGARSLKIGLLYSNPSAAYLSEFLLGSLEKASQANVQLIVERCEPADDIAAARRLIGNGVDGLVLPPPLSDAEGLIAMLKAEGVPAIGVAVGEPHGDMLAIRIDDYAAAREMTAHIVALGHQRIGFVRGNPNQTVSERRLAGYRDAIEAAGLAVDPALIVAGDFTYRSGLDAMEALLDLAAPPTAVFASNDDMAAAAVAVAHQHGLDVPGDISVCGFDDTAIATTIWPELTTVHQPIAAMSRLAMEVLVGEILRGPEGPRQRILDFSFVRRQSDAAPRRRPKKG